MKTPIFIRSQIKWIRRYGVDQEEHGLNASSRQYPRDGDLGRYPPSRSFMSCHQRFPCSVTRATNIQSSSFAGQTRRVSLSFRSLLPSSFDRPLFPLFCSTMPSSGMRPLVIRRAEPCDFPAIQKIETLAGEIFRTLGMDDIADDEPPTLSSLHEYHSAGRAWVACNSCSCSPPQSSPRSQPQLPSASEPIAYILISLLDAYAHVAQVTVHPYFARQGIGKALIEHVGQWAKTEKSLSGLSLTTFEEVPWNAPYYMRMGFGVVSEESWTVAMKEIMEEEREKGLLKWPRVVMVRAFGE